MPAKKKNRLESVGGRIRQFRIEKSLSLENVANETGLSVEYIRRIESGKQIPPVGTLLQISRALQIDSGSLFKAEQEKAQERIKAYAKRTDNYAYTTLTPGAENKHLKAFRVTVDPLTEHQGVGYRHDGEEFVYVLSGSVEMVVGDHINRLSTNDSLHFNSGIAHNMKNVGKEAAELLVVIYNP